MLQYIYSFISVQCQRLSDKYSFNREINDKRIRREKILLPVNKKGEPDYLFMQNYMKSIETKKVDFYTKYISARLLKLKNANEVRTPDAVEWGEFHIGKLFTLSQGKSKGLNHLTKAPSGINYLGATNLSNGVLCQVKKVDKMIHKGNAIAFIRNGEGSMGYSVYKSEDFIATSDITVGYSEFLNRHIGLFITTMADKVRGKYNFGYKRSAKRLKKEKLMLPITKDGNPDYKYMENYMKKLEYDKLKTYLETKKTITPM